MSSLSSLQINKPIDWFERTPLICACEVGADRRIIDILIDAGSQFGAKDVGGLTALHLAVLRRRLQAVKLLLSRGSNVNEKDIYGSTPLHLAVNSSPEWTDGVKAIMNQSAVEVNPRNKDGQTPLQLACYNGYLHTVELLLGHNGIDANVVNNNGDTPLHMAVRGRQYKVVCAMLSKDSVQLDIKNHQKVTPLLLAVSIGHLEMVHQLIAKGADVNVVNNEGNNCLHLAVKSRRRFHSEVEPLSILDKVSLEIVYEYLCVSVCVCGVCGFERRRVRERERQTDKH
ncbi:ankyrin repeat domain-containing protein 27-like isoform X1 [Octopus sinensis]|uniref:Ankyrin repeat domain-containing protein 27-like isoform X1 n=2 Tax=Octopus sinensis TaxID=2607531 RepID=A0A6P7TNW5_9MOLL|nr:ankyrin repeat domain-containing protein 27-like isoform X1 [Octopus sinensis]XP_036371422.1 ankyrin repeat domain-containing protein 27-like isoform X1 [Octopus sinensis]